MFAPWVWVTLKNCCTNLVPLESDKIQNKTSLKIVTNFTYIYKISPYENLESKLFTIILIKGQLAKQIPQYEHFMKKIKVKK
jgi:hypothetical protein